jgi:hypothetical protein
LVVKVLNSTHIKGEVLVKVDVLAIVVRRASERIYIALIEYLFTVTSVFTHLIPCEKNNPIIFIANQHIPEFPLLRIPLFRLFPTLSPQKLLTIFNLGK